MPRHHKSSSRNPPISCSSDLVPLACMSGNVESVAAIMESADRESWTTSDIRLGLAIAITCGYDDIVDYILSCDDVGNDEEDSRIQSFLSDSAMHKLTRIQMFSKNVLSAKKEISDITDLVSREYDDDDDDDDSSDDEHSCYRGISEDDYSISGTDDFEIGSSSATSDDDDEKEHHRDYASAPDEMYSSSSSSSSHDETDYA